MKKGLFILLTFIYLGLSAQDNNIGLNLTNLLIAKPTVDYERAFAGGRIGLQVGAGVFIPKNATIIGTAADSEGDNQNVEYSNRFTGFTIVPELRFYPRGDINGFYFGPYLKYAKRTIKFENNIFDIVGEGDVDFKTSFNSMGAGIVLGHQWTIADVVSIDWYWFGFGLSRNVIIARAESDGGNAVLSQIAEDLEESADESKSAGSNAKIKTGDDYVEMRSPFFFPNMRFGLSVGICF